MTAHPPCGTFLFRLFENLLWYALLAVPVVVAIAVVATAVEKWRT